MILFFIIQVNQRIFWQCTGICAVRTALDWLCISGVFAVTRGLVSYKPAAYECGFCRNAAAVRGFAAARAPVPALPASEAMGMQAQAERLPV